MKTRSIPAWSSLLNSLILVASFLGAPPQPAAAAPAAGGLSPQPYLQADGSLDIPAGLSGSFDLNGWDVRLDAARGVRLQPARRPAAATLGTWTSLGGAGTDLNGSVSALLVSGGVLYAGGLFTNAGGDANADYIAKFSNGAWSSLGGAGTGLNGGVYALILNAGVLYAGGTFTNAGGDPDVDYIASFSGGTWSRVGTTTLNNSVLSLVMDGGVLYAGGFFSDAGGDTDADYAAKFSGGVWSSLGGAGTGLNNGVLALIKKSGVIYAGGFFTDAGGDIDADHVAKYSGGTWSSLGGAGTGLNDDVYALAFDGGTLYAGGFFIDAGGDPDADRIAKFSGGAWSSLGGVGLDATVYSYVRTLLVDSGVLYIGGEFNNAGGDSDADYIAKFEGGIWSSLGGVGTGLNNTVVDLSVVDGVLIAGGAFINAGGDADADRIAQYGLYEVSSSAGSSAGGAVVNKDIAASGTTTLYTGRFYVSVPASALPPGAGDCHLAVQKKDDSGAYGFSLDDQVWDVKVVCDGAPVSILYAPITVCIRPLDGVTADKQLFHRHSSAFNALPETGALGGYVCGQTQVLSLFTLGSLALPTTGFAPGIQSALPTRSAANSYTATDLTLDIPELDLHLDIVGVPQNPNGWDVSWLTPSQAGYLYGSAFPTMAGNTVLTAHVWNADNSPGPFAHLDELRYGDRFSINAWGATYTYEVRSNALFSPSSLRPLTHEDYDWVTLITCHDYDPATGAYAYRRVVRAVLVGVK